MKLSFLFGSTTITLLRLFVQHRCNIGLRYIPRFTLLLCISVINTLLAIPDLFYRKRKLPAKIVFVMGHYRSGTTHLLNLLCADGTLKAPTTFSVLFPDSFLFAERFLAPLMNKISPGVRAMDNMEMKMESPQEEEIAMAAMGAPSPYLAAHFPVTGKWYSTCVSFLNAEQRHVRSWKKAHQQFVRKQVRKYGEDVTLVLKSPANTARVQLLREMYPDAKYVFIHRDPYRTLQSSMHLYDTWYKMGNFQSLEELKKRQAETVLDVYCEVQQRWIEDRKLIPGENRMEVSFSELDKAPIETIKAIRRQLQLGEGNSPQLKKYVERISGYRKNSYKEMDAAWMNTVKARIGFALEEWGGKF